MATITTRISLKNSNNKRLSLKRNLRKAIINIDKQINSVNFHPIIIALFIVAVAIPVFYKWLEIIARFG